MCYLYPRGANTDLEMPCLPSCHTFVNHQYWLLAFCLFCQYASKAPALFFSFPLSYLNSLSLHIWVQERVTCFGMFFVFPTWPFQMCSNRDDLQIYVPAVLAISVSLLLFLWVRPPSDLPFTRIFTFLSKISTVWIHGFFSAEQSSCLGTILEH